MVNHCEGHKISQNIEHQLQESILYHYLKRSFFLKKKPLLSWDVCSTQLKPSTDNYCDMAHPYKLFTVQYLRYDDSLFSW